MKLETPFELAHLSINPQQCLIKSDDGSEQVLQPKFIDVLTYMAAKYPSLVSREELIETIWQGNFPVGEKALTNAVWHLRQHLKDTNKPFIETVRKRGYRLLVAPQYQQPAEQITTGQPARNADNKPILKKSAIAAIAAAILCYVCFATLHLIEDHPQQQAPITVSNLTTDPGQEFFPVVSPKGRYLAYVWHRIGRPSDLYIKDLNQPNQSPRQLTFDDKTEVRPVWHPDGERLYYVQKSWDRKQCQLVELRLSSVQTTTSEQTVIGECPSNVNISIAMSPDGKRLAFTGNSTEQAKPGIYFLDLTRPATQPERFSCADDCQHQDRNFAFSPDGRQLVVSRRVESLIEDIFVVDLGTRNSRQLTFGEGDILGLIWHPDGDRIVYGTENYGSREGHVINLADGSIEQLEIPGFSFPDFVPGSHQLVFHHSQIKKHLAYLSVSDKLNSMPFPLIQSEFNYSAPHFCAATQRLVFISNESGHDELWSSKLNGDDRKQLTFLSTNLRSPRWSNNGKNIVFIGPRENKKGNNLFLLNVQSLTVRQLGSPFNQHQHPSWLWDDSGVIAGASNDNVPYLHRFSLNDDSPQQLLSTPVKFAVQTADQKLWFTQSTVSGLWQFDPNQPNTPARQILDDTRFDVNYNWTVSEKGVYFQHDYTDHQRINFYDFKQQSISSLVKLPLKSLGHGGTMNYLPDADKIVFTQSQSRQVDIKRLDHPLLISLN